MAYRKKLIEVALPLEAINKESAREKSIRYGHPSTLHLWWARRPLAACRAVLFASLVDDPSSRPEEFPTEVDQAKERRRLFCIIEDLVKWENSNNEKVLNTARQEILKSTGGNPPPVLDPFCGGGSIPLEAQRLGLEAQASDLNPVAVLITKALIEIPPRFAGRPPVNPETNRLNVGGEWPGATGLARDIYYYGRWMRNEAERHIGHLYPKVTLPAEYGGGEATVIAWLWARTVKCPNPACGATMPLVRSFWLSTRKGKEAWIEPIIDQSKKEVNFKIHVGKGKPPEGTVNRRGAKCICCGTAVPFDYIRNEGKSGRMEAQILAIVGNGQHGRIYISSDKEHEFISKMQELREAPDTDLPEQALGFRVQLYGMTKHCDLFTPRQLTALITFSDLIEEVKELVYQHAIGAGYAADNKALDEGGTGARAYAEAVVTYLALAVDKCADYWSSICSWHSGRDTISHTFTRQAIPMTWDFTEANPFSNSTGNFLGAIEWITKVVERLPASNPGKAVQRDATACVNGVAQPLISTDPPYYDNIGYADLSDFFYIWLRRSVGRIYPEIFSTLLVPKAQELVANPYRFEGDRDKARAFFETGLGQAFNRIREKANPDYPLTVYYAFKQSEEEEEDSGDDEVVASTGWETMLNGLIGAGFTICGTWPMRSELNNRPVANGTNALASSIVLVCRPRSPEAGMITRREFTRLLRNELPVALKKLQQGNIAPVDLAQAAIGPGMAIFSRYEKVLEANGEPMPVRTALQIINQELDAYFAAQEGELDPDTRFCIAWFEQFGLKEADYGTADILARAKNTVVERLQEKGMLEAVKGKVRLLKREELVPKWSSEKRECVWLCTQYLVRLLNTAGETAAAKLAYQMGSERSEAAKSLAYRLYTISERNGWAEEALAYNTLVVSWPDIQNRVAEVAASPAEQLNLFG